MRRTFVVLSLVLSALSCVLSAGCGAESPASFPATSAAAQGHPLQSTAGRAGWALVSNDPAMLSIGLVANPDFAISSARVCVSTEPFGWVDPSTCGVEYTPASATHQTQILVKLEDVAPIDELCSKPLWLQIHAPVVTTDGVVSTYAGAFKARVAYALACDPAPARRGCVREAREWAKKPEEMPVDGLVLGGKRYSRTDVVSFLESGDGNDASVALARELSAAKLNGAAERPGYVAEAMEAGDAWLLANGDVLPFGLKSTEDGASNPYPWDSAMNLASLLERYNAATFGNTPCP